VSAGDTYFVDGVEVDKAEYVRVERACGFRTGDPARVDEPATSAFAGTDQSGDWRRGRLGYLPERLFGPEFG
jgi:hypothetical protein